MAIGDEKEARELASGEIDEVERLLAMAERLDRQSQEQERSLSLRWMLVATCLCVLLMAGVGLWALQVSVEAKVLLLVALASYACVMGALLSRHTVRVRGDLRRDRRAAHEMVSMLREIERAIAGEKGLTALGRAELRIRLSRLDIGPEYPRMDPTAPRGRLL
jgi:Flp pilus assembly protein TadB